MPLFSDEPRLFLLDGMALVYRAHYALIRSPRYTSTGQCTSAVFGMANTVLDIIQNQGPTHLAAAFDTAEPTQRHTAFPEYKAQREEIPEDLAQQLPLVDRLLNALNIVVIRQPGYEADDILGTLARQAETQGIHVFLVSPDKDLAQLVSPRVSILKPGRQGSQFELLGEREILAGWRIQHISQVVDILGLMGDASDNIPGVPGIGEKTAQKLIETYGSIENLLNHAHEVKGKLGESLRTCADQARQSKQLVTIHTDVPLPVQIEDLRWKSYDPAVLQELFRELEFETFGKRLFGPSFRVRPGAKPSEPRRKEGELQGYLFAQVAEDQHIGNVPHEYQLCRTPEDRRRLLEVLRDSKSVCIDTETTGLDPRQALPLGIAFCTQPHHAAYVALPDDPQEALAVLREFRPILSDPHIEKIGHNLKYDLSLLRWCGIEVRGALFDTMLAHSLLEPDQRHGLDFVSRSMLGYSPIPTSDLIGERGPGQRNMREVPVERVAEYACEDVDVTWQLCQRMRPLIRDQAMTQVCYDVEFPLIPVLIDMEFEGIRLDVQALRDYAVRLEAEIQQLRERIYRAAGREFNIDSPKQLGTVLYQELKLLEAPKKTATGQFSTREAELLRLAPRHAIVADILEYRNAVKLKSVYLDQLPQSVDPRTGRVHTHYTQAWTATGRIQSNDPNLQTIPIRKQRGREIRAAFVPRDENYWILSADYSQIELRIMAELSGDPGLLEAFRQRTDIHAATAAKVFKVDLSEVTREMRDRAKAVNFGIIYGISAFGLHERLNIPKSEAQQLIDSYFEKYPGVREYIESTIRFAREHGYVTTKTGRRRTLRDINSRNNTARNTAERLAMNSPIQGTAADMLKLAMIRIHHALRQGGYRTKMLLTVHDEIVFDLHKEERDTVLPLIEEGMKGALPMTVPIEVEFGMGENWLEAH